MSSPAIPTAAKSISSDFETHLLTDGCVPSSSCSKQVNPFFSRAQVRCPICNMKFAASDIEQHADFCLLSHENPFIDITDADSPDAEIFNANDGPNEELYLNITGSNDETDVRKCIKQLIDSCPIPKNEPLCQFNVRRSSCFEDFLKFLKRSWNKGKKESRMIVSFMGEHGVDTGGPLREFFSCKCIQCFLCQIFPKGYTTVQILYIFNS